MKSSTEEKERGEGKNLTLFEAEPYLLLLKTKDVTAAPAAAPAAAPIQAARVQVSS